MEATERRLAKAIWNLIRSDGPVHPPVVERQWRILAEDVALLAFFRSMQQAGEDAREEERARVLRIAAQRVKDRPDPIPHHPTTRLGAVEELLPQWREWGRALLSRQLP